MGFFGPQLGMFASTDAGITLGDAYMTPTTTASQISTVFQREK